jgi:hypothetical protein
VLDAFRGAINASDDRDAILSIMRLKGFGSAPNVNFGKRLLLKSHLRPQPCE